MNIEKKKKKQGKYVVLVQACLMRYVTVLEKNCTRSNIIGLNLIRTTYNSSAKFMIKTKTGINKAGLKLGQRWPWKR